MKDPSGIKILRERYPSLHIEKPILDAHKKSKLENNSAENKIEIYLNRLEKIFLNKNPEKKKRNINILRQSLYDAFIIKKENFPESYFELQKRIAKERGQEIKEIDQATRERMKMVVIEDQKASLDNWINYLTSEDAIYPTWFKYLVFRNIISLSQFDKELNEFKKRNQYTTAIFPDIYYEALAKVCDEYEKVIKDKSLLNTKEVKDFISKSFPIQYAIKIQESLAHQMEGKEITKGEWVKYQQGNDEDARKLYKSVENKGTGWCTAGLSTAKTQINSGDFYVFYSNNKDGLPVNPRLAIRMQGDEISEVRGILQDQNVESQLQETINEKLKSFGDKAKKYEKQSSDMKRLTEIYNKWEKDNKVELTKEELSFLYEIDNNIEGFGYNKDPRIKEIKEKRNEIKDYTIIYNCKEEEILTSVDDIKNNPRVEFKGCVGDTEIKVNNTFLEAGILNLCKIQKLKLDLTDCPQNIKDKITEVKGTLIDNSKNVSYSNLQSVGGDLGAGNAKSLSLNNLQSVGGDLGAGNAKSLSLNALQSVGRYLHAGNAESLSLNNLQSVGGDLGAGNAKSLSLNALQSVGGDLGAGNAKSLSLNNLQSVGGDLGAGNAKSLSLNALQSVGRYLHAGNAESLSLNNLQSVGGDLGAGNAKSLSLNALQSVGGDLGAGNAKSLSLNNLQSVGGDLGAGNAKSLSLNALQSVGRYLHAGNAESLSLNNLQSVGGYLDAVNAKSLSLNNLQSVGVDLYARNAESLSLNNLQSVGGNLGAGNAKSLSLNNLQSVGVDLYARNAESLSLNALQSVGGAFIYKKDNETNQDVVKRFTTNWDKRITITKMIDGKEIQEKVWAVDFGELRSIDGKDIKSHPFYEVYSHFYNDDGTEKIPRIDKSEHDINGYEMRINGK